MARARAICRAIGQLIEAEPVTTMAVVGGGGAPGVELASAGVALATRLAALLRTGEPAVVGRVVRRRLVLDLMAVDPGQDGRSSRPSAERPRG